METTRRHQTILLSNEGMFAKFFDRFPDCEYILYILHIVCTEVFPPSPLFSLRELEWYIILYILIRYVVFSGNYLEFARVCACVRVCVCAGVRV